MMNRGSLSVTPRDAFTATVAAFLWEIGAGAGLTSSLGILGAFVVARVATSAFRRSWRNRFRFPQNPPFG